MRRISFGPVALIASFRSGSLRLASDLHGEDDVQPPAGMEIGVEQEDCIAEGQEGLGEAGEDVGTAGHGGSMEGFNGW